MPVVEELWNNTTSPYKNWHKNIKWFIIFKPNKFQKNRKETKMEKLTWRLPAAHLVPQLAQHCAAQLDQPTSAVVLLAPVGQACGRRMRTAVPPRHLPACPPPRRVDASRDATRRPAPLSLSLSFSLLWWIPLSRPARALPSPPLAVAVAIDFPSPR